MLPRNAAQKPFKTFVICPGIIIDIRGLFGVKGAKSNVIRVSAVSAVSASPRIPQVKGFTFYNFCDIASTVRPRPAIKKVSSKYKQSFGSFGQIDACNMRANPS